MKVPPVRVEDPPRQPNWWLPRLSSPLLAPECTVCSFEAGAVLRISPRAAPEHEAFFAALHHQVLSLRRELCRVKIELAEVTAEKDELSHVARRLNKQLAEQAALNKQLGWSL